MLPFITTLVTVLTLLTSVASDKTGRTFAVNHFYGNGPLVIGRMDPVVSPGVASGHVHAVQGGSNFALTMSDDVLLESKCTSSLIKNDFSNYWTPTLWFQDPNNGSFESVNFYYMNVYYFFEATDDDIVEFPVGLRMVVGNPNLRTPPATGGASILDTAQGTPQPVQWTCPRNDYDTPAWPPGSDGTSAGIQDPNNKGAGVGFPDINCDALYSPMRADIHFPSCYNPEAGLDDYKNNTVFPSSAGTTGGKMNCPPGWKHLPHIFYEVYWDTQAFADRWTGGQGKQPFVLSNGDPTGYSLHADFISGWVPGTLQQMIDNCNAGDSGMDKCPGLIGGINDAGTSCNIPNAVPEQVTGTLDKLPGNNPIVGFGGTPAPNSPLVKAESSTPAAKATSTAAPAAATSAKATSSPATGNSGSSSGGSSGSGSSGSGSSGSGSGSGSSGSSSSSKSSSSQPAAKAAQPQSQPQSTTTPPAQAASPAPSPKPDPIRIETEIELETVTVTTTIYVDPDSEPTPAPSSSTSTKTTTPSTSLTVEGHTYLGCHSDSLTTRALQGINLAYLGPHNVTTTSCISYCDTHGFSLSGTEYGGQCFCGNELLGGSTQIGEDKCDMPCEGEGGGDQICGGSLAVSLWRSDGKSQSKRGEIELEETEKRKRRHARHLMKHLKL